jgi:radical SAM superfamily enzyme YgiQ (UPF0313 family)
MENTKGKAEKLIKNKIGNGWRHKRVLLTTLGSPFMDNQFVFPSLGILYLVSVAEKIGMRPKFVDTGTKNITDELIKKFDIFYTDEFDAKNLKNYKGFDVIGISCMTPQGEQAYQICHEIKKTLPEIKVIIGGPHSKNYLNECIKKEFDIIVTGDGERVFEELLTGDIPALKNKMTPDTTPTSLVFNDYLDTLELNKFPPPYRDPQHIKKYKYLLNGQNSTTMVNSRGCPMGCAFCEDRRTVGRWYSVDHFKSEVESILDIGLKGIMIFDDLFATTPNKLRPYLEVLKYYHKKKSLIFRCFGHANIIARNPEMLDMLYQAGCVEMGFGAESASQTILDNVLKGVKTDEMHYCVEKTINAGIKVKAFFMIALPGETEKTFNETYQFIKKYRLKYPDAFDFDLAVFYPFKGTLIGNVMRLQEGEFIKFKNKKIDKRFFDIRIREGYSFAEIDYKNYGAYKKKGGDSDIVVETFDWEKEKTLLSAENIQNLKETVMKLSRRYTDKHGNRIFAPILEGNIASLAIPNTEEHCPKDLAALQ